MKKIAFITGASAGIGKACAVKLAQNGYSLILNARRGERLHALSGDLKVKYRTESLILPFDVRDHHAVKHALENIPEPWQNIQVLLNNAGLAMGLSTIDEGKTEHWEAMIDTNIKGLLYVSKYIIPLMKEQGKGHIINLGSIAGKEVYPKGNVYCATKFAVDALTRTMRVDLLPYSIKVSSISPGAVDTEFSLVRFEGDASRAKAVYEGYTPLTAEDIAESFWFIVSQPANVCINDVVITPIVQANTTTLLRKAN